MLNSFETAAEFSITHLNCGIQSCDMWALAVSEYLVDALSIFSTNVPVRFNLVYCWWIFTPVGTHGLAITIILSILLSMRYAWIPNPSFVGWERTKGMGKFVCINTVEHWSILLKCLHLSCVVVDDDAAALWCSVFADERLLSVAASRSDDATAISARMVCKKVRSAQVGGLSVRTAHPLLLGSGARLGASALTCLFASQLAWWS